MSFVLIVDTDGAAEETSYLFDLLRYLHRAQNYIMSSPVLLCLEKHVRVSQKKGKFRCPECQAVIDLPDGNRFDRLPNSFFHKSSLNRAVRQVGAASIALLVINAA